MILQIRDKEIVNKHAVRLFFAGLKDGRYELKADRLNKRSNAQNRYLWGVVYPLMLEGFRDMGWDEIQRVEQVHEICKYRFLKIMKPGPEGEAVEFTRSTTALSKLEFNEYKERIQQFASEFLNVYIPDPNEQTELWND